MVLKMMDRGLIWLSRDSFGSRAIAMKSLSVRKPISTLQNPLI